MVRTIKILRIKYISTACAISFSVIILMLIVLNTLMNITYYSDTEAMLDMILHNQSTYDLKNESFILDEMEKNQDGDFIIPRNVNDIESVTLAGEISAKSENSGWYCAGGGLMFEVTKSDGQKALAYREYTFNKDTREVTIDFISYDNLRYEENQQSYKTSMVNSDNFLVSVVWWTNYDNRPAGEKEGISLTLSHIVVHYKDRLDYVKHIDYNDSFKNNVPDLLTSADSFCIVTDEDKNLIAVNHGNMSAEITDQVVTGLVHQIGDIEKTDKNIFTFCGKKYQSEMIRQENLFITAFVSINGKYDFTRQLLIVSVISGIFIMIILSVIIIFISGMVVKPVSETFEKQKQFISNAGHELKTPITVISASTDLLEKQTGENRWLDCIKAQSGKMSHLVNELLELSRLSENKNMKSEFRKFNLSQAVNNTLLYFESRAYEENHEICTDITENITFYGEQVRIERLVGILLDNALKYSDDGSKIKVTLKLCSDRIQIICANRCDKLSQSDISRLFERFYRNDKSHSSQISGFGLGLSIAQEIVWLHKGEISVSLEDNIIIFKVSMPNYRK